MFVLRMEFILLRHALSASLTNWKSYRALYAEIALPRICLSYLVIHVLLSKDLFIYC